VDNAPDSKPLRRRLIQLAYAVPALIGLKVGYDAGLEISGVLLGVFMALNAAVCFALVAGSIAERLLGTQPAGKRKDS
jgi:hypothetical protein